MDNDTTADAVPTMELDRVTLIYDRARGRPLLRLRGVVVVPVGATMALPGFARHAVVVGVRLLAGSVPAAGAAENAAYVCLDVEFPAVEGEDEAAQEVAVPGPIAAATADMDLDPDAAKPLGTPLSSAWRSAGEESPR